MVSGPIQIVDSEVAASSSIMLPRKVVRKGRVWFRVSVVVRNRALATAIRSVMHDPLIRAAGFTAARRLTDIAGCSGAKHRAYIPRNAASGFARRVRAWVKRGDVNVWVAGKPVRWRGNARRASERLRDAGRWSRARISGFWLFDAWLFGGTLAALVEKNYIEQLPNGAG